MTNKPTDRIEAETQRLRNQKTDTRRLDWLDEVNRRTNERIGTVYGWRFDINHNRAALMDHNSPALTIRQAIDKAMTDHQVAAAHSDPDWQPQVDEPTALAFTDFTKEKVPSRVDEDYRKGAEALAEFVADHDWGEPPVDVGEGWVETSRAKATYYRTRLPGEGWDETGWKPISGCQDCSDVIYQFRKPAGVRFGRPEGE